MIYSSTGEFDKALTSLNRAIDIKPDYQKAYCNRARTYLKMGKLCDASEAILSAIRLDANDQNTLELLKVIQDNHLSKGYDYFSHDNLSQAESSAKKALSLDSSYQPAIDFLEKIKQEYYTQACDNIENDKHIAAINFLKKTLEIDSDFKEAYYSLGETYFKRGELESAKKEANTALRIDQDYKLARCLMGSIKKEYYKQGCVHIENSRYLKGINKLKKANEIEPHCEKTHYYLGKGYFKLDRLKEAKLALKETLSIQPNYPQARELLSEINHPRNWPKLGVAWILDCIGISKKHN